MSNNEISNLSLINRDYKSIYDELINAVSDLTKSWNIVEDTDPGVVLIKLMAMLGDMLSYNHDKSILELYPSTVTQRKNAIQLYSLIGYKMRWYRSAEVRTIFSYTDNISSSNLIIPAYSTFTTNDGSVNYTNLQDIQINPNGTNTDVVTLVQGTPITPARINQYPIMLDESILWHKVYGYNVQMSNIINNRIYFENKNIDEKNILLIDDSVYEDVWQLVDNINSVSTEGKYFQFMVDEEDNPYIELINYWGTLNVTKFKLFYIKSDGVDGVISYNTLKKLKSSIYKRDKTNGIITTVDSNNLIITNEQSTLGYDPETIENARVESAKYINTYDTLVTVEDFKKAVMRLTGVLNCHVTDLVNDIRCNLDVNTICIYVLKEPNYYPVGTSYNTSVDVINEKFAQEIINAIEFKKAVPVNINVIVDTQTVILDDNTEVQGISIYEWCAKSKIYFNTNLSYGEMNNIASNIDTVLRQKYDKRIDFNKAPVYLDVIDDIKNVDNRIRYVELDNLTYYKNGDTSVVYNNDNIVSEYIVSVRQSAIQDTDAISESDTNYQVKITLAHKNLIPGTFVLTYDNGDLIIIDNGDFRVMGQSTLNNIPICGSLISDNSLFINGEIDYINGIIRFNTNRQEILSSINVMCKYSVRAINVTSYAGINNVIQLSNDCMYIN